MKIPMSILISASVFGALACNTASKNSTIKDEAVPAGVESESGRGRESGLFMAQVFVSDSGPFARLTTFKILGKISPSGRVVPSSMVDQGNGDQFNIKLPNGFDPAPLINIAKQPNGEDMIIFKGQLSRSDADSDPFGISLPGFSLDASLESYYPCLSETSCRAAISAMMDGGPSVRIPNTQPPVGGPSVRIPNTQFPGRGTFVSSFSMLAPRLVESASPIMPMPFTMNTTRVTVVSNCNVSRVNGLLVGDPNLRSMKAGPTSEAFDGFETTWTSFSAGKRLSITSLSIVVANNTRQQLDCAFHIYND